MVPPASSDSIGDWGPAVHGGEDRALTEELQARLGRSRGLRPVSVTDLLALRRAFWRLAAPPVPVAADRRERMDAGRAWHRRLGALLGEMGALEVRVRREGLVGRIDALTDRPIEVKTSAIAVGADHLLEDRPEYVEQLGMYCALVGGSAGRVISLAVHNDRVDDIRAVEVAFHHPERIFDEMRQRADLLRKSWESRSPEGLPGCPFYDRGCEFRSSSTCDCTGREKERPSQILADLADLAPDPEEDRRLRTSLGEGTRPLVTPSVARFREMVYPRRAYFERTRPPPPSAPWVSPLELPLDAYARLVEAIESGPVGEVTRLLSRATEPDEEVAAFRGDPFLVRASRARVPPRAEDLVVRYPQYALELGFRCAVTGRARGRVFMTFEGVGTEPVRVRVFDVRFTSVTPFARLWRSRVDGLARALRSESPADLAPCPSWMFEGCDYRDECACGADVGRSQR